MTNPDPFTDLEALWSAQPDLLDVANPKEIIMSVQESHREERKRLFRLNVQEVLPAIAVFLLFGWQGLTATDHRWAFFVGAALCLFVGGFLVVSTLRQHRIEQGFGDTTRAALERSKSQLEHRVRLHRSVAWWYLLPLAVAMAVVFLATSGPLPVAARVIYFALCAAGAVFIYRKNLAVARDEYEPKVARVTKLLADLDAA